MTQAWSEVRWAEARQIAETMGVDEDALPEAGVLPHEHLAALRRAGRRDDAVAYLGHALQRFDAIAWAGHVLDGQAAGLPLKPRDRQALDHALRWLGEPTDDHRRTAYAAAEAASETAPERLLGIAVFLSGGSISLPDLAPVLPPPAVAGRMAAMAIIAAAGRAGRRDEALDRALDLGEKIANQGARNLGTS